MIDKTEAQIMATWQGDPAKPLLSVRSLTYNHVRYLSQALDGILMQVTDFPFEVIVHDDASTDGTTDLLREYVQKYPNIIVPIIQTENQYSKRDGSIRRAIDPKLRGKYIALCEGDDYWTDEHKLQRQVHFLEEHPGYTMCVHAVNYVQDGKVLRNDRISETARDLSTAEIIEGGGMFCATASICGLTAVFTEYPEWRRKASVGDYPLQILMAVRGRVHCMPEIMGCYRVMSAGSWSQTQQDVSVSNKRRLNEIAWLKLLDEDTGKQYHDSIARKIAKYAPLLFRTGAVGFREAAGYVSAMPAGTEKLRYYISLLRRWPENRRLRKKQNV